MSKQEIDALFRKKLENAEARPSAGAWGRVSENLHGAGDKRKFYWSIAAGIAVIFTVGIMIGFQIGEEQVEDVIVLEVPKANPKSSDLATQEINSSKQEINATEAEIETGSKDKTEKVKPEIKNNQLAQTSNKGEKEKPAKQTSNSIDLVIADQLTDLSVDKKAEQLPVTDKNPVVQVTQKVVEPAVQSQQNSQNPIADATPETEDASEERGLTLKKVIAFARDFKTDNDAWGSLREAKNELLTVGRKRDFGQD